jgi:hypothetical protein
MLGAYTREATTSRGAVLPQLLLSWLVSVGAGLSLRGALKGAVPPMPFIVVSLVSTLVFLSIWRVLFVSIFGSTSDDEYRKAGAFEVFKMVRTLIKRW